MYIIELKDEITEKDCKEYLKLIFFIIKAILKEEKFKEFNFKFLQASERVLFCVKKQHKIQIQKRNKKKPM